MKDPWRACLLVCVGVSLHGRPASGGHPADQPPNILVILADDLGFGDVACYNPDAKVSTPHLDRLARQGMRFTDAHSAATVCTPTRYSLLTGRMCFRTGYRSVFTGAGGPCLIPPERLTIAEMLKQAGYHTAMVGKWHVGMTFYDTDGVAIHDGSRDAIERIDFTRRVAGGPLDQGFDRFFGTVCCPTTDWLYAFLDDDRVPVPPTGPIDKSPYPTDDYTTSAPALPHQASMRRRWTWCFWTRARRFCGVTAPGIPTGRFSCSTRRRRCTSPRSPPRRFVARPRPGPMATSFTNSTGSSAS